MWIYVSEWVLRTLSKIVSTLVVRFKKETMRVIDKRIAAFVGG